MKLYGSLNNRFEENKMLCETIEVGTGMTEYSWSDRHAYEVVDVVDQKHVSVREYDHKLVGEAYTNNWELISNPENPIIKMVKRGNYWFSESTVTKEDLINANGGEEVTLPTGNFNVARFAIAGFDLEKILAKGKQTKLNKMNVSFGVADYYYDYEF